MRWPATLLANVLILSVFAAYAWIDQTDSDLFYRSVQEDEWLEWATVWAFAAAAFFYLRSALRTRSSGLARLWFPVGLALFCAWVALEEISWGQRLIGYRPPAYFLQHNFQQEFNLHNVVEKELRELGMAVVLLGYGVLFPFALRVRTLADLADRLGVFAPALALVPSFAISYAIYFAYPLRFTGEIVEAMMGLAFAFAAADRFVASKSDQAPRRSLVPALCATTAAVAVLGSASTLYTQRLRAVSPEAIRAAEIELDALQDDFRAARKRFGERVLGKCGMHNRLYTAKQRLAWSFLESGRFARLTTQGMPHERAEFLLDPWNSPYWIRDDCDDRADRRVFVYSFGPNRQRDSNRWEVRADDLGATLFGAVQMPPRVWPEEEAEEAESDDGS